MNPMARELATVLPQELGPGSRVPIAKLRAMWPTASEGTFNHALSAAIGSMEEKGFFIRRRRGELYVCAPGEAEHVARTLSRHRVVRAGRRYQDRLVHLQKVDGLAEDVRIKANAEEVAQARLQQHIERVLLRRTRKRPPGLEED